MCKKGFPGPVAGKSFFAVPVRGMGCIDNLTYRFEVVDSLPSPRGVGDASETSVTGVDWRRIASVPVRGRGCIKTGKTMVTRK